MPKTLTAELTLDKPTKNKLRFREPGTDEEGAHQGIFPVIYIRKESLINAGMTTTTRVRVTVEAIE